MVIFGVICWLLAVVMWFGLIIYLFYLGVRLTIDIFKGRF